MSDLNNVQEALNEFKGVRVVYIPAFTAISIKSGMSSSPEQLAEHKLGEFITYTNLCKKTDNYRVFGFNNPSPSPHQTEYAYEFLVTITEDIDIPRSYERKKIPGGLYAAHSISMGDFNEWKLLSKWVRESNQYTYDEREPEGMEGCMEEQLNAYNNHLKGQMVPTQLDLLLPIKEI